MDGGLLTHLLEFMEWTIFFTRCSYPQLGLGANIIQEALYPAIFTDIEVRPLNGTTAM
jgi:hypothetical protein